MNLTDIISKIKDYMNLKDYMSPRVISPVPESYSSNVPTPTPTRIPTPTPVPNELERETMGTFDNWKIPREVAFGIANAEGGNIGKNNIYNIGAVDSNPQNARNFDSILQSATSAAKMLSGNANDEFYGNGAKGRMAFEDAFNQRERPEQMLDMIMNAGYAGDPKTWKARSMASGGAGLHYDTWADFVKDTPGWKKWAGKY